MPAKPIASSCAGSPICSMWRWTRPDLLGPDETQARRELESQHHADADCLAVQQA